MCGETFLSLSNIPLTFQLIEVSYKETPEITFFKVNILSAEYTKCLHRLSVKINLENVMIKTFFKVYDKKIFFEMWTKTFKVIPRRWRKSKIFHYDKCTCKILVIALSPSAYRPIFPILGWSPVSNSRLVFINFGLLFL